MSSRRVFQVPPTRLPFINGEIAQLKIKGEPHLVSGIWGNEYAGGRIYFWNPLTGSHFMRPMPKPSPGVYMLQPGPDGRLYLGDGRGDLYRYDPEKDAIELLVKDKLHSITWGGCVTDRYVVWTADPGEAVVYDWRDDKVVKTIARVDSSEYPAHYGHYVLEAPDGKILLFMDTPQARICVLDPKDMSVRTVTPEPYKGQGGTLGVCFFDANTLAVILSTTCATLSYPQLELKAHIGHPAGTTPTADKCALVDGTFYALFNDKSGDCNLYGLSAATRKWELKLKKWLGEDTGYLGNFQNKQVAAISVTGQAHLFDPRDQSTKVMDVENVGQMEVHAMAVAPERDLIVGAPFINARFWTIDMTSGEGKDQGRGQPGGGQINQVLWDAKRKRAYFSAYTAAAVMEYNPEEPAHWPTNPHVIGSADHEDQMRPWQSVFDGRAVWMATSPHYGKLGGAVSRVDVETHELKVWRNIVPDQTINYLVLDARRRRIYFSSEIYGDMNSSNTTQTTACVGAIDIDTLKPIRIQQWTKDVPAVGVVCLLPDGRVLVHQSGDFFSWDCGSGDVKHLGRHEGLGDVATDDDGTIWMSFASSTGRLEITDAGLRFVKVLDARARQMQIVNGKLYFSSGLEIHEIPMDELRKMAEI
jgi:hypothetical protein